MNTLVKTSYKQKDVIILLQNLEGKVPILDTKEREILNQKGIHYSEMLPLEYTPTEEYMNTYYNSLKELSKDTANAVAILADKIYKRRNTITLVSLARAGTPIGILVKKYLKYKYDIDVPHYSISIIRGKGIDKKAMDIILETNTADSIVFLDGWIGKGAINKVLEESMSEYPNVNPELAVLSDPASVTQLYGTRQDFLIPSACLNSTVSGLISRTVKLSNMTDNELHGAIYYKEQENNDESYNFINEVVKHFDSIEDNYFTPSEAEKNENFKGLDEVKEIAKEYNIDDINKIKPGVGETTRVLLRRVPDFVIINSKLNANSKDNIYLKHIIQLAKDKKVPIIKKELKKYNVVGVIKDISDL